MPSHNNLALLLLALTTLTLTTTTATADVVDEGITALFPEPQRYQDITVTYRVEVDSTQDVTANLYLEKPNGTTKKIETTTSRAQTGNDALFDFQIPRKTVDQYGEYTIIANETSSGNETRITANIVPEIETTLSQTNPVIANNDQDIYFTIHQNALNALELDSDEIQAINATVYNTTNPATHYQTYNLSYDPNADAITAEIPEEDFQPGQYLVRFNWYYQSKSNTQRFYENLTTTYSIRIDYAKQKWGDLDANTLFKQTQSNERTLTDQINDVDTTLATLPTTTLATIGFASIVLTLIILVLTILGAAYIIIKHSKPRIKNI